MFCRFCGAETPADSRFCPKCGKRIAGGSPRAESIARRLGLRTPYPYAGILLLAFGAWAFQPRSTSFDFDAVRLAIELDGRTSTPEESLYRHHFSIVVENVGEEAIRAVPVELRVEVTGAGLVRVDSDYRGLRLPLFSGGAAEPLLVVLDDNVAPGGKHRYTMDGIVTGTPPFEIVYRLADPETGSVLAEFTVEEPAAVPPIEGVPPVAGRQ
jgi:RNA polymerase subunit RPABC4/transcription elongation factor Spt4